MRGPLPSYRPEFPPTFVEPAAQMAQPSTVPYQGRQRATLVLLLHHPPRVSTIEAAEHVQLHPRAVQRWRRRWATGDFALEDEPGRGRTAVFPPCGPRTGQGRRLCTERGNHATPESAVSGRRHCTGSHRAGQTAQSQHGVADVGAGCPQTVAGPVLDLSACSRLRRKGWTDAGSLGREVAGPGPWPQGPRPQCRRKDQYPGPSPLPSLAATHAGPTGFYRERRRARRRLAISGGMGCTPRVWHGTV